MRSETFVVPAQGGIVFGEPGVVQIPVIAKLAKWSARRQPRVSARIYQFLPNLSRRPSSPAQQLQRIAPQAVGISFFGARFPSIPLRF